MHQPVVATPNDFLVPALSVTDPDLCHDRGPEFPRPKDSAGMTVAHGFPSESVHVSGGRCDHLISLLLEPE